MASRARSYGIALARALTHAGMTVVEVERPKREQRRGRGKSDPIDAHLAALQVLRMDADRLPLPRADGDREALRILLVGRRALADTQTRKQNQLKALLLAGDAAEQGLSTGDLTDARLGVIIRRRGTATETRVQAIRRAEARRLARAILDAERELRANKKQLRQLVEALAPALLTHYGIGPVSAAQRSSPGLTTAAAAPRPPSPSSAARAQSRPAAARSSGIASTAAAIANSTTRCTRSR